MWRGHSCPRKRASARGALKGRDLSRAAMQIEIACGFSR
jgi:hypothetical protein